MRPGHQGVEIRQRAEDRVDIAIIRHVIAEVAHRAPEKGRKPDRVHPERRDIGQMRGDAGKVAYPVAVGVGEAARRSEEHTSELQSLMRTSYAGFCLNKKTII